MRIYAKNIKFINNKVLKINLITPVQNKGFSLSLLKNYNSIFKIILSTISLIVTYYFDFYLFLFSLLNYFERIYLGYVNDYIEVKVFNFKFVCNISDILMFLLVTKKNFFDKM